MTIENKTDKKKARTISYNFYFSNTTKTTFSEGAEENWKNPPHPKEIEGRVKNLPCIVTHFYHFTTNDEKIPKEKFELIEKAIYEIINKTI